MKQICDDYWCGNEATKHTNHGSHYCEKHFEGLKVRLAQRRRIEQNNNLAKIESLGKGNHES